MQGPFPPRLRHWEGLPHHQPNLGRRVWPSSQSDRPASLAVRPSSRAGGRAGWLAGWRAGGQAGGPAGGRAACKPKTKVSEVCGLLPASQVGCRAKRPIMERRTAQDVELAVVPRHRVPQSSLQGGGTLLETLVVFCLDAPRSNKIKAGGGKTLPLGDLNRSPYVRGARIKHVVHDGRDAKYVRSRPAGMRKFRVGAAREDSLTSMGLVSTTSAAAAYDNAHASVHDSRGGAMHHSHDRRPQCTHKANNLPQPSATPAHSTGALGLAPCEASPSTARPVRLRASQAHRRTPRDPPCSGRASPLCRPASRPRGPGGTHRPGTGCSSASPSCPWPCPARAQRDHRGAGHGQGPAQAEGLSAGAGG